MNDYLRAICFSVVGVLLCMVLSKNAKDYSLLIGIILCCVLSGFAARFLEPVLELADQLGQLSGQITPWLSILIKAVGISFIGETATAICADAGQAAVGKTLQMLTTISVIWVSIPLVRELMDIINSILEML